MPVDPETLATLNALIQNISETLVGAPTEAAVYALAFVYGHSLGLAEAHFETDLKTAMESNAVLGIKNGRAYALRCAASNSGPAN